MNTIVKISNCGSASAAGKDAYLTEREKADRKKDIEILEKNPMPVIENLSKSDKKLRKNLQTKLSIAKKRLEKAIDEKKEKSINTNKNNIKKYEKELEKFDDRPDKREKHFTEFTISLTNSKDEKYAENWSSKTLNYFKKEFPDLEIITAVEHKDQASPHLHLLMYSKSKPVTHILAERSDINDTSREGMKKAYSNIANSFHDFADKAIGKMKKLEHGRKYVSLGQFKEKGNFEYKRIFEKENPTVKKNLTVEKEIEKEEDMGFER